MYFRVEFNAGMKIEDVCIEAVETASSLGINIVFNFNGIELYIRNTSSYHQVLDTYYQRLEMVKVEQFAKDKSKELEKNK